MVKMMKIYSFMQKTGTLLCTWTATLSERKQHIGDYKALVQAAAERGLVSVTHYKAGKTGQGYDLGVVPILTFHWSSEMARSAGLILAEAAMSQMNELKQWLSAIEAGAKPDCRECFPPNIDLVQHGDADMQMVVWPTVGNNSYPFSNESLTSGRAD